jgi:hypothetical protein
MTAPAISRGAMIASLQVAVAIVGGSRDRPRRAAEREILVERIQAAIAALLAADHAETPK